MTRPLTVGGILLVLLVLSAAIAYGFVWLENRDLAKWDVVSENTSGKFVIGVLIERGDLGVLQEIQNDSQAHFNSSEVGDSYLWMTQGWRNSGYLQISLSEKHYKPDDVIEFINSKYATKITQVKILRSSS